MIKVENGVVVDVQEVQGVQDGKDVQGSKEEIWTVGDYPYFEVVNGSHVGDDRVTMVLKVIKSLVGNKALEVKGKDEFNVLIRDTVKGIV